MSAELVNYRVEDGVAVLELSNPPVNAYSYEMFRQIDDAILRARMDDTVHVIVVTGAGDRSFCAGADIAMLERSSPEQKYYFCLHANETLLRLEHTPKLVIAAINGHCVGGGFEIALACDLRVAREGAGKVGLPEIGLGVLPGTGGTQRLTRLLGRAKALELMVRGDNMDIYEAHGSGLVTSIVSGPDFRPQVMTLARSFCPPAKASRAVGLIKRAVHGGADLPLEAGLALERELQQRLFTSEDAREGLGAYLVKRTAEFKGR